MENHIVQKASFIEKIDSSMQEHYSLIVLDSYAMNEIPCDTGDLVILNEDLKTNQLMILHEIDPNTYYGYTHIVQDFSGDLYAVALFDSATPK